MFDRVLGVAQCTEGIKERKYVRINEKMSWPMKIVLIVKVL